MRINLRDKGHRITTAVPLRDKSKKEGGSGWLPTSAPQLAMAVRIRSRIKYDGPFTNRTIVGTALDIAKVLRGQWGCVDVIHEHRF